MSKRPVALITGGGKRVGNVIAETLAEHGYNILLHYHRSKAEAEQSCHRLAAKGVAAVALQADFTREEEVEQLVQAALGRFGRIDVLVNNASIWQAKPLEQVTAADVQANLAVNTLATFICAQQVGLAMTRQAEGGIIINLGDWAIHRPYLNYAAYFVSKGTIPTLTRCLAVELGTRNPAVRVNCILPGPVMFQPDLPQTERTEAIQATLVKRAGRPEHVAQAVLFCIQNDFVTGACLPVDGGRIIYAGGL